MCDLRCVVCISNLNFVTDPSRVNTTSLSSHQIGMVVACRDALLT